MKWQKYLQVAKTSWQAGFVYRLSFVMWRVRVVVQFLAIYFLWTAILGNHQNAFGYTESQLLTYIIGTSIIRTFVFSSRSIDAQGEIASGDLSNYLVKPLNYFTYWLSRDISDKLLNILFMIGEIAIFIFVVRPPLFFPSNLIFVLLALIATILAIIMYYYFSFLVSMTTFWLPEENGWPQRFLIFVLLEFLAGGLFPLNILPPALYKIAAVLPPAYMLNHPLQIYLGKFNLQQSILTIIVTAIWIIGLREFANRVFKRGLKVYGAYGR